MTERGYEILSIDDLDGFDRSGRTELLRPLRRRIGVRAFGTNCWEAPSAGDRVIPRHRETGGDEELYVVLRGHATFTVDGESIDAPAGTLVFAPPQAEREALGVEAGTIVLAVGATPGEAFRPSGWEDWHVADALRRRGDVEGGRRAILEAIAQDTPHWGREYNAACYEALAGDADAAFDHLRRATTLDAAEVWKIAPEDDDLATLRADPRWEQVAAE